MTNKLKSLGPALAGVFTGVALVSGIKSFVGAAAEAEKAQAQLNAVLRSTNGAAGISAAALNSMAQAFQKTTTFSDEAVNGVQSLLLTFTNIKANVFEETTQAVLDMSQALGQGLKESSIQLGKALQDPIAGVTALRRAGVMLTDDQEKLIKKLVETGNVMEAQKIILKEIATEFGGSAAAAANTFAGKLAILNNKFDEMKETVGRAIINALLPALTDLGNWFDAHQKDIEDFAVSAVNAIRDLATDFGRGLKIISDGLDYIPNNQARIIAAVVAVGAAMAIAFGPMSLAVVGLAAIVTLLGRIGQGNPGGIKRMAEGVMDKAAAEQRLKVSEPQFDPAKVGPHLSEVTEFNELQAKLKETGYSFDAVKGGAEKLVDVFGQLGDTFQAALSKVGSAIGGLFSQSTRESLVKNLGVQKLQLRFDELGARIRPSIDRLEAFKDSLSSTKDRLDSWGESISARRSSLSDASSAIDDQIAALQKNDAGGPTFTVTGKPGSTQGLRYTEDPRIRPLEAQKKGIDAQQKALDREEEARQRQLKVVERQEKAADLQIKTLQAQQDQIAKSIEKAQNDIKIDEDRKGILETQLKLLDKTVKTEAEFNKAYQIAAEIIPEYTRQIKASADVIGISLIPGFDDLTTAASAVKAALTGNNGIEGAALAAVAALRKLADPNAEPLKGIPHRAGGGSVLAGMSYIVGERGPELFRARTSGQIVPNSGLRGMARAKTAMGDESGLAVTIRGNVIVNNNGASQDADGAIRALGYMIRVQARSRGAALAV